MEANAELKPIEDRLCAALDRMDQALGRLEAQYQALSAKLDHIVATIDEPPPEEKPAGRKTLSPAITALLAKNGLDGDPIETSALAKALASLSVEQRIAVKAQLARAGIIE